MSQVQAVLKALVDYGTSTYDDLEKHTEIPRNSLRWTVNSMKGAGLIKQTEAALTNELAWNITPKGEKTYADGEAKAETLKQLPAQPRKKHPGKGAATPVAGGANISHSRESESPVGEAATSTDVPAVVEQPEPDKTPAEAGSDVMTLTQWARQKLLASTEPGEDKLDARISITGSLQLQFAGKELELPCYAVRELGQFLIDTEPAWR